VLSNRLANAVMLPTQLFEIFHEVLISDPDVREGALADVEACRERVSACASKASSTAHAGHMDMLKWQGRVACGRWVAALASNWVPASTCWSAMAGTSYQDVLGIWSAHTLMQLSNLLVRSTRL
jgi:hypothetical protein